MDKGVPQTLIGQRLSFRGASMNCCGEGTANPGEQAGIKLCLQVCFCPAAFIAANTSLLEGEETQLPAPGLSGHKLGKKGKEAYNDLCWAQVMCGPLCCGLPVIFTANLMQRQRLRDKYGLQSESYCSEFSAGCCYPCSIIQSQDYLLEHRAVDFSLLHRSRDGGFGPLKKGLIAARKADADRNKAATILGSNEVITPLDADGEPAISIDGPLQPISGSPAGPRVSSQTQRSLLFPPVQGAATDMQNTEVPTFSVPASEAPTMDQGLDGLAEANGPVQVTLFGSAHAGARRTAPSDPSEPSESAGAGAAPGASPGPAASTSAGASTVTGSSGSTAESIPAPEVTDSPRHRVAASLSFGGASGAARGVVSSLGDSASFPIPSALPLPVMALGDPPAPLPPPTEFAAVPAALRLPDSADSEVMAAWLAGPKLTHLSQSLKRPNASRGPIEYVSPVQAVKAKQLTPAHISSQASLFSINLNAASPCQGSVVGSVVLPAASPEPRLQAPHGPADQGGPDLTPTSSREPRLPGNGTITSSRLSAMIDRALLGSSGAGTSGRGSGSSGLGSSGGLEDMRHSVVRASLMATIEEADGDVQASRTGQASASAGVRASRSDMKGLFRDAPASADSACSRPGSGAAVVLGATAAAALRPTGSAASSSGIHAGGSRVPASSCRYGAGLALGKASGATWAESSSSSSRNTGNTGHESEGCSRSVTAGLANGSAGERDEGLGASADNFSGISSRWQPAAPPRRQPSVDAPMGMDDCDCNFASLRPSIMDGPELQAFQELLRNAAGEEADDRLDTRAMAGTACGRASAATITNATILDRAAAQQQPTATAPNGAGGRYMGTEGCEYPSCDPGMAARYAHYAAGASPGDQPEPSASEEDSSAIDGPVSSADTAAPVVTLAPPCNPLAKCRSSAAGSDGYDGDAVAAVAVAANSPSSFHGSQVAVSAARQSQSAAKQSFSALSNGDSNAAYSSAADSASVAQSQHKRKHWVNWAAAQSVMSMGASDAGASTARGVRLGHGRQAPTNGAAQPSRGPLPSTSCNSVNQQPLPITSEQVDDTACSDQPQASERWA